MCRCGSVEKCRPVLAGIIKEMFNIHAHESVKCKDRVSFSFISIQHSHWAGLPALRLVKQKIIITGKSPWLQHVVPSYNAKCVSKRRARSFIFTCSFHFIHFHFQRPLQPAKTWLSASHLSLHTKCCSLVSIFLFRLPLFLLSWFGDWILGCLFFRCEAYQH